MSLPVQQQQSAALLEQVLIGGDLARLKPEDRVMYYQQVCESVGLNPITKPFEYITLNGKLTLYALRSCTEQLRKIHGVSILILSREVVEDCYVVTARATDAKGRNDESIGAVNIQGLKGEARSNAMMKAETKAKRRVTLSICGLGMLDESEADSVPGAYPAPITPAAGAMKALPIAEQEIVMQTSAEVKAFLANDQLHDAYELWQNSNFDNDQKVAFWSTLDSKQKGVLGRMAEAEEAQAKGTISEPQRKRLEAIITKEKLDREALKEWCQANFMKGHFKDLTRKEMDELDAHMQTLIAEKTNAAAPAPQAAPSPAAPDAAATLHITEAQEGELLDLLEAAGISIKTFLTFGKLKRLGELPSERFEGAKAWIEKNKVAK